MCLLIIYFKDGKALVLTYQIILVNVSDNTTYGYTFVLIIYYNKSFQWGCNIRPGASCFELDVKQCEEDYTSIVRDSSYTWKQKTWFSDNETWSYATKYNTILQSIIYQNWAESSPMLAWIWCPFPPSHDTFHYLYRDSTKLLFKQMLTKIYRAVWHCLCPMNSISW